MSQYQLMSRCAWMLLSASGMGTQPWVQACPHWDTDAVDEVRFSLSLQTASSFLSGEKSGEEDELLHGTEVH